MKKISLPPPVISVIILVLALLLAVAQYMETFAENFHNLNALRQIEGAGQLRVFTNEGGVFLREPFCDPNKGQPPQLERMSPHLQSWSIAFCGQSMELEELSGPMADYFNGWILAAQGRLDEAAESWRNAGAVDVLLGKQAANDWQNGDGESTLKLAEMAEMVNPAESAEKRMMYHALCNKLLDERAYTTAVSECERAARNWDEPANYYWLGLAYFNSGNYETAVEYFTNNYAAGGNPERALYWRARSYAALKQLDAAIADLQWVIKQDPEYNSARFAYASILRAQGDSCGAAIQYDWIRNQDTDAKAQQRAQDSLDQLDTRQCP